MIKIPSAKGEISVSDAVFTNITGNAATNCFGVKAPCPSACTSSWNTG